MKFFATFLLLAIAAACISAQRVTTWGDVHGTRILAEEKVVVGSTILRVQERTVTYRSNGPVIVRGVMHLDYKTKSRATASIVQGGIGQNTAAVKIVSERGHGLNSVVRFYG